MIPEQRKIVEAILLVADDPVPATTLAQVMEKPRAEVEALLAELADGYVTEGRGFVLRRVAGGWRLYSNPDCAPWLERFVTSHKHPRLTGAALEVLAIVAYRQPIARAEITEIRGVESDGVVKTLAGRGLIEAHEQSGASPALFSVSDSFLEATGLDGVHELPRLADFIPDAETVQDMETKLSPGA
ncbi:MAG TPA: SMC-Scp complex subunit ScpB [Actinomycetota bacterium]|nr:SMC-Scp complex subunit ScpB [Actinomycetota bacterium]